MSGRWQGIRIGLVGIVLAMGLVVVDRAQGQTVRLQSWNASGSGPANDRSDRPVISGDGQWIVFESRATDHVANDTNGVTDVFLRNRSTGATVRVSESSAGGEANGASFKAEIGSSGGQPAVVYESVATDLVANDTNGSGDIFLTYQSSGVTQRVSVSTLGVEGDAVSTDPDLSGEGPTGQWVVFASYASNLVSGDTNGAWDIFVHEPVTQVTRRINLDANGNEIALNCFNPTISEDGRYVAYMTQASNVVPGWLGNGVSQVFVIDRDANGNGVWDEVADLTQTEMITVGLTPGSGADDLTLNPRISGDGQSVVFQSRGSNLVPGDTNGAYDIFVRDRQANITTRVSVDDNGTESDGLSENPRISSSGRFVVFQSDATNLDVTRVDPSDFDSFVHDRLLATTRRVSETGFYGSSVNYGIRPDITDDGRFVAFRTNRAFDPIDTNSQFDIYVKDRITLGTTGPRQVGQPFGLTVENAAGESGNRFLVLLGRSGVTPGIPVPNTVDLTVPIQPDNITLIALGFPTLLTGTIQADGAGATPTVPFPNFPAGIALYGAALTWDPISGQFESVSEPISF